MKLSQFDAFPRGVCERCLTTWRDRGLPGKCEQLEDGRMLVAGYCSENESGFWALADTDGRVTEWTIRSPIAVEEWSAYIALFPAQIRAVRAAMRYAGADGGH